MRPKKMKLRQKHMKMAGNSCVITHQENLSEPIYQIKSGPFLSIKLLLLAILIQKFLVTTLFVTWKLKELVWILCIRHEITKEEFKKLDGGEFVWMSYLPRLWFSNQLDCNLIKASFASERGGCGRHRNVVSIFYSAMMRKSLSRRHTTAWPC
ncbi:hypothetical protein FEM48_Zijuj10G0168500 [Ziziphus jujuba var. spinosa]|uniref:Uncharacterized protein n=1 Tax=Ziziphus jujuba var. spinosa TaxID=714518 RepID=A0A978UPK3_ZIZJJ|nr:hypothetical protein FEM48_Zijuj10G0168500 [Ziziphus jujuba var. spinosa]